MIRMVNDPLAGGRERNRPHSPHEQFHAERIFESTDLNAVARLGEVLKGKRDAGIVDVEDRPRAPLVVSGSFGTACSTLGATPAPTWSR
jgi:hypothetical protein